MTVDTVSEYNEWIKRIRPFWALSRTPHLLLDMAAPILAALLALGGFPSPGILVLGAITAFAGYTAVYALNDVVDYHADVARRNIDKQHPAAPYLDDILTRHPMAAGTISMVQGVFWVVLWSAVALIGAYRLNPVCMWIFVGGVGLEIVYCRLWTVTPLRTLVNGVVKSCGPLAAVFAVLPAPPVTFLVILFFWVSAWEIGGQNIPADWTDIEEDRHFNARTIPVVLGPDRSATIAGLALAAAFLLSLGLCIASPLTVPPVFLLGLVGINIYFLLIPAGRLNTTRDRQSATALFNRASYYPVALLGIILARLFF